jgi:hypothetical protein
MKITTHLGNALLALVSILFTTAVAVVATEIYLRSRFSFGDTQKLQDMVVFHEERGWELKPGKYRTFDPGAMTLTNIRVNNVGLRGEEVQPKASPARERVTLVGDSFLFAMALDEMDAVPARVQAAMGDHYEIVNVSVPGYGTGQEILLLHDLRKKGYDWGSHVILAFFTNDIQDNLGLDYGTLSRQPHKPAISVGPDGMLRIEKPIRPPTNTQNVEPQNSRYLVVDFLRNRGELIVARFPALVKLLGSITGGVSLPRDPGIITGWYTEGWEARWEVTSRLIEYMAHTVRANGGIEFDIVFIPSPFQVEPAFREIVASKALNTVSYRAFLEDIDRPQRMLMGLCDKLKVRCIDATAKLRVASRKQPTYFLHEGHLNAYGVNTIYDLFVELARH